MNPRVIGLILLVIGLGVALYFFNIGGVGKISSIVPQPPSSSLSVSTTTPGASSGGSSASSTSSSSENPIAQFFSILFAPFHAPTGVPIGPTIPSGSANNGSGGSQYGYGGSTVSQSQIPPGFTAAQLSPYFHLVRFNIAGTTEISLTAPWTNGAQTPIDITGWEIKTNRGGEYIPQAVNLYDPASIPVESDIFLTPGQNDFVNFYSNSSPVNLRLNECMGFLNQTNQFNPQLPAYCPQVNQSQISAFTGACQNYILSLSCQPVNFSSPQIPRTDYACQDYLKNNFTYNSCIHNHAADQNFLSNEWHIWMGSSPLDFYHDNVELLDRNGFVVDTYSY
jgi:hypothetical protein